MSKNQKSKHKIIVSAQQADYNAANDAYQHAWRRASKVRDRHKLATREFLNLPLDAWGPLALIRFLFGRPLPQLVEYYASKYALAFADAEVRVLLDHRESAYKALIASQS